MRLATALIEREGRVLLVASRYPNHSEPLWNLPGGRVRGDESYIDAAVRELGEETGLAASGTPEYRYSSESHDAASGTHFVNVTFGVDVARGVEPRVPERDAHVVALAWIAREDLGAKLPVRVVREPLLAHLADPSRRYFALGDAGITIDFNDAP